ncbi:DUF4382 domain-containing protein [Halobacteria archaeon AArc-curdl1]|uniref:DUF4382 domain-containing protein n=1 Tax=Natronosalvus hydrolyticus TaxID=2979988 RepID=A0AAP2Z929_9EURY|nr:DUF4382 domain-containing protein [Halobacteria archaeon AArc-curdl1]
MSALDTLRRRTYLQLSGGLAAAGLAGCLGDESTDATGTLATSVTDQPGDIADFESCVVTVDGVWIKRRDDDSDDETDAESDDETTDDGTENDDGVEAQDEDDVDQGDGREYLEFGEPQEADLVELQGENTQLIDERELTVGSYEYLQLDVSDVDGQLEDGGQAEVSTPGNAPLQFNLTFEIREDERTGFIGDFTPVRRGQTERYLLQPVARGTRVIYEDEADDDDTEDGNETTDGTEDGAGETDE